MSAPVVVTVTDHCVGHGLCQLSAPAVYQVDPETGCNEAGTFTVPAEMREQAVRGAGACPERAITVSEA